jgi:hypothetical protein
MRSNGLAGMLMLLISLQSGAAQLAPASASSVANLGAVVVNGVQPGPGMWRVSRGEHVLWILGTLEPLPKKMQWRSRDVIDAELASQEMLLPPALELDSKSGFFGNLLLLPRLIGIRNNPGGARLVDVIPPAIYARWRVLKAKYLGHDHGVERFRPMFAGFKLYDAAIDKAGLSDRDVVKSVLLKTAKKHGIKVSSTSIKVTVTNPKAALTGFRNGHLDDLGCFAETLGRVDNDLTHMQARANAWATGDLAALRLLPHVANRRTCGHALAGADVVRKLGLRDLGVRFEQTWLAAATRALAENRVTFALLPIENLLSPDGYLAKLREQGYVVESPGEQEDAPAADASTALPAVTLSTGT